MQAGCHRATDKHRCSCLSECLLNPCLKACEPCFHHNLEPGLSHLPLLPDRHEEPCRPHLTAPLLCLACLPSRSPRKRLWGRRTPALEPRNLFSGVWGSGGVGTTRRWGLRARYTRSASYGRALPLETSFSFLPSEERQLFPQEPPAAQSPGLAAGAEAWGAGAGQQPGSAPAAPESPAGGKLPTREREGSSDPTGLPGWLVRTSVFISGSRALWPPGWVAPQMGGPPGAGHLQALGAGLCRPWQEQMEQSSGK